MISHWVRNSNKSSTTAWQLIIISHAEMYVLDFKYTKKGNAIETNINTYINKSIQY